MLRHRLRHGSGIRFGCILTRLSRPFRSVRDMTELAAQLDERGIDLVMLDQGIDTPPRRGGSCSM
ncbi:recombinase family protein [Nocardia salmonicida]|uniref:recombinase family protein n=1 Tax=Nocardia salmonicida TaxID=53431 RepID=UPI0033E81734